MGWTRVRSSAASDVYKKQAFPVGGSFIHLGLIFVPSPTYSYLAYDLAVPLSI